MAVLPAYHSGIIVHDDQQPLDLSYNTEQAILAHELSNLPTDYDNPPPNRTQLYNIHKKLVALSQLVYSTGLQSGRDYMDHGCYEFQVLWRDCMEPLMPDLLEFISAPATDSRICATISPDFDVTPKSYSNICRVTTYFYKHLLHGFPRLMSYIIYDITSGYPVLHVQTPLQSISAFVQYVYTGHNTYFATIPRDITTIIAQLVCDNGPIDHNLHVGTVVANPYMNNPNPNPNPILFYQQNDAFTHNNCKKCPPGTSNFYTAYEDKIVSRCGQVFDRHRTARSMSLDGYEYYVDTTTTGDMLTEIVFRNVLTGQMSRQQISNDHLIIESITDDYIYCVLIGGFAKIPRGVNTSKTIKTIGLHISFVLDGPKSCQVSVIDVYNITLLVNGCLLHSHYKNVSGLLYHANNLYFIAPDGKIMQWSLDFLA